MWPLWFSIFGWFLSVLTVAANGLVIYLIATKANLRTSTTWFVLSLAVADFGVGATNFPLAAACQWKFSQLCVNELTRYTTVLFFIYASVTSLCALILDQCLTMIKAVYVVGVNRVALLLFVTWGLPVLVIITPLNIATGTMKTHADGFDFVMLYGTFLSFLKVSRCISLLFTTVHIFLSARRKVREHTAVVDQHLNDVRRHSKVSQPLEAACAVFALVVAAFTVCYLLDIYDNDCYLGLCKTSVTLLRGVTLLSIASSAVNPLVYAFLQGNVMA